MSTFVTGLRCTLCHRVDREADGEYACAQCGGIRDVEYDYEAVARTLNRDALASDARRDIRRYGPLLPIDMGAELPPLHVGPSPLYEAPRLAASLGVARAFVKDDGRLPTGSFKDRASYVGVARAMAKKQKIVAAASTGNAATSLAGMAASVGLSSYIFVPMTAPEAKVAQLCVYGARVFLVKADYDATYDLCQEAVARFGWYNRSAAVNPFLVEGKKTCGLEIAESMAHDLPDWVSMSVGDGCSIAGTFKGLEEMKRLGLIERVPRMLAVQAAGAAPLTRAFEGGAEHVERMEANTLADSINVGMPRNPVKALRAVRRSHGAFVNVTDDEILAAIPRLARDTGVFGEPAAVTALAGVAAARRRGIVGPRESVLVVNTGNGLKDVRSAVRSVAMPTPVEPTLAAVEAVLRS